MSSGIGVVVEYLIKWPVSQLKSQAKANPELAFACCGILLGAVCYNRYCAPAPAKPGEASSGRPPSTLKKDWLYIKASFTTTQGFANLLKDTCNAIGRAIKSIIESFGTHFLPVICITAVVFVACRSKSTKPMKILSGLK